MERLKCAPFARSRPATIWPPLLRDSLHSGSRLLLEGRAAGRGAFAEKIASFS
jgi:hypothetical protein